MTSPITNLRKSPKSFITPFYDNYYQRRPNGLEDNGNNIKFHIPNIKHQI